MVDDRLRNIREGAGKDDSRYSELMTDLLQKAGPWIMGAVIIGSGGYLGYKWYDNHRTQKLAAAFFELEEAINSGSPKSLETVAREHAGQKAVTRVAELELGEIYLTAARRGVAPGATLVLPPPSNPLPDAPKPAKAEGLPENDDDLLTPDQVSQYMTKAAAAFQSTLDATKDDPALALHTIKALFGLAAVAETKGDVEAAGRYYTDAAARATKAGFDPLATLANKRKETSAALSGVSPLLKSADLPARIVAASPFPTMPTQTLTPGATTGTSTMNVTGPAAPTPTPTDGPVGPQAPVGPAAPASSAPANPAPGAATPPATPPAAPPATPPSEPKADPKR